jgi:integrase
MHFCMHSKSLHRFHDHTSDRLDEGMMMARKANGQGHTYKVGNSYRTAIRKGNFTVTAMGPTAQESRRRAKAKLESLPNLGSKSTGISNSKLFLEVFLDSWLTKEHKHQIAHSTLKRYQSLARFHINPSIGKIELRKLTASDINQMLSNMRESGQSPRSQQQARALLSVALQDAERKEYILVNPVKKVRVPINRVKEIDPLGIEDVRRLLDTYDGSYMSARLHIALLCGLRQGEALGLRWQDINFQSGILDVRNQIQVIEGKLQLTGLKTDRSRRSVALTSATLLALEKHQEIVQKMRDACGSSWRENDFVFPYFDGSAHPATPDYNNWKRCLRLCGIKTRRLHDARHTAATLMYAQGVGIEVISRALGHSSSAITSKLYVHSAIKPQIEAANAVNAALFSN